jgi:uncharacterized lipoprotein YmbA
MIRLAVLIAGASLMFIIGCLGFGEGTQTPTTFYVLNSLQSSEETTPAIAKLPDLAIGVGPVRIPQYLERPQIVRRASQNQLGMAEFAQWAEPIRVNISRVMAENLSVLLATKQVSLFPWLKSINIDYQIVLEITRFDGNPENEALLRAKWSVFGKEGKEMLTSDFSNYSEPIKANDTEALIAAQSRTVEQLSREIAGALKALAEGKLPGNKE